MPFQKMINTRTVMTPVTNNEETQRIKKQESHRCILLRYSLLHLECHSISFSIPNPIGLFSSKLGQRNLKNLTINWDLRHKKTSHSKCNRLYYHSLRPKYIQHMHCYGDRDERRRHVQKKRVGERKSHANASCWDTIRPRSFLNAGFLPQYQIGTGAERYWTHVKSWRPREPHVRPCQRFTSKPQKLVTLTNQLQSGSRVI